MNYDLIIEPEAEADILEAFAWYEEQRRGLGDSFLLALEGAFGAIQHRPMSFALARGMTRRAPAPRFPYGVFFVINDAKLHVIAVLHAKRDPKSLGQRIDR